jgi:hypothetical protein
MKRSFRNVLLGCTAPLAFAASILQAQTVLLDDTFADGDRTNTSRPGDSAVYVGSSSAVANVSMSTGSLAFTQTGSSQRLVTYFASNGAPVSLGVGDSLVTTFVFTPRTGLYDSSSRNFRVGVFTDPTNNQLGADGMNDNGTISGGDADPWGDATGYAVQMGLSNGATTSTNLNVGKRTNLGGSNSLLGSSGAYTGVSSGDSVIATLDTAYTGELTLARIADQQMLVTFTLYDGSSIVSTNSVLDDPGGVGALGTGSIFTDFDMLAFRFSSATGTADVIDFSQFKVEYFSASAVPEPSTYALFSGLFVLGLMAWRRRRRS